MRTLFLPLYALAALTLTASAQPTELRGVWMTPRDGSTFWSREQIAEAMQQAADANFNTVNFLAWSRGWPLWRSHLFFDEFGFATDPAAGDRNILEEAVEEAHKRGLSIEAWMEYGFVAWWTGNDIDSLPKGPVFRKYPHWLARDSSGNDAFPTGAPGKFYWMAHSNPDVQRFLSDLHAEVVLLTDVDGVELDRIRYPRLNCGYDSVTVAMYASEHDGVAPPMRTDDPSWMRWRADQLNRFHALAYAKIKAANPRAVVSNAPFHYAADDSYPSYEIFLQDWRAWMKAGVVDVVHVQMYSTPENIRDFIHSALRALPDSLHQRFSAGIAVQPAGRELDKDEVEAVLTAIREARIAGMTFWYFNDLRDKGFLISLRNGPFGSTAELPHTLQDMRYEREVAPGVVHTSYTLEGPYTLDVLSVNLSDTSYVLESYRPDSLTRTTEQVVMAERSGATVLGAVNADFFSFKTHWPVGNQISGGVPVTGLDTKRTHISISANGEVHFGPASFAGNALLNGGVLSIVGLNAHDTKGEVFLFTPYWVGPTGTTGTSTDVRLGRLSARWTVGDTILFRVQDIYEEGNAPVSGADAVLSFGDGMASVRTGDTIRIIVRYEGHDGAIRTMLGGAGTILDRGAIPFEGNRLEEGIGRRFIMDRHPRTFVGIDRDTTTLFLCTVDGRQAASVGMNFREMARFLRSIGVWHAINFDGGGSTTMVVGDQIVNSPSDRTGERPVANSLMILEERN